MYFILPQLTKAHQVPGVYQIIFDNKWVYFGSSENLARRLRRWHACLNTGTFLKSLNIKVVLPKCEEVKFVILELVATKEIALDRENEFLKRHDGFEFLLNRCPEAHTNKGCRPYIGQAPAKKHLPASFYYRPVAKFTMSGTFIEKYESVKAAAVANGTRPKKMTDCLRRSSGRYKGCQYKYINQDGSYEPPLPYRKKHTKRPTRPRFIGKKVHQMDSAGNLVAEYFGLETAANSVGLKSAASIHAAITGKKHTAAGFVWKYADAG